MSVFPNSCKYLPKIPLIFYLLAYYISSTRTHIVIIRYTIYATHYNFSFVLFSFPVLLSYTLVTHFHHHSFQILSLPLSGPPPKS